MLIFQAAAQVQLMTGRAPKTDVMRGALEAELARRARVERGRGYLVIPTWLPPWLSGDLS